MFKYEKMLEYPINIKRKDLKMAKLLSDQLGGANGELAASLRYLCQRFTMPDEKGRALLSDIGCEEMGDCEMIANKSHKKNRKKKKKGNRQLCRKPSFYFIIHFIVNTCPGLIRLGLLPITDLLSL